MNKTITLLIIGVIFLALLLMVFNSFQTGGQHGVSAPVTAKTSPRENIPPAPVPEEARLPLPAPAAPETQRNALLAPSPLKAAPQPAENAPPPPSSPSAESVAVRTVPAQIDAGQSPPAPTVPLPSASAPPRLPPPKAPVMPEPGDKQTSGGSKNITNMVVFATQEGATLRLGGDNPLVYTSSLLREPDRLVLDFEGHWNMTVPGVPQNRLIKALRVGRQVDATRLVVDLHRAPASYRLIKTSKQGLDVRLR